MNAKRMIAVLAIVAMAFAAFAVLPAADDVVADDKEVVYLHGEITSEFNATADQKVIVDADTVITSNGTSSGWVNINGELIVNEGVTVTIEAGCMNINSDAQIDGSIVSKTANGLNINGSLSKEVVVNGTLSAMGNATGKTIQTISIMMYGDSKVVVNGTFYIGANAAVSINGNQGGGGTVEVTKEGKFLDYGDVNGSYVYLRGYLLVDSPDGQSYLCVKICEASAVIDIISINGTINVENSRMYVYTYGGEEYTIGGSPAALDADFNAITSDNFQVFGVKNLRITETVKTEIKYDEGTSANRMVAETKMVVSALNPEKQVEAIGSDPGFYQYSGKNLCLGDMTVYGLNFYIWGVATVSGTVVFPLQPNGEKMEVSANNAVLNVNGCVIVEKTDSSTGGIKLTNGTINAAHYAVKDEDNKYTQYYMPLQKAIDSGATDITMLGVLTVDKDITVPAPVKLTLDKSITSYPMIVKDDATFTVSDGAKFDAKDTSGFIVVYEGAIVFENIDFGITFTKTMLFADVKLQDGQKVMFSDIYRAFAKAEAGAELEGHLPLTGYIIIDKDLTLPAGVTFTNNSIAGIIGIHVYAGVTFTVDGKLVMSDTVYLAPYKTIFNDAPEKSVSGEVREFAVIKIGAQGVLEFPDAASEIDWETMKEIFEYFKIPGAYYHYISEPGSVQMFCISNIPHAFENILDLVDELVLIMGDVTIDTPVSGSEEKIASVYFIKGDINLKGFTIDNGEVIVNSGATLTGDIGTATGRVILNKATTDSESTFRDVFVNDAMNLVVGGTIISNNATEISGIVYLDGFTYHPDRTDHVAYASLTYAEKRFVVPAGAAVFVNGIAAFKDVELLVAGELTVMNRGTLTADNYSYVSVLGTLTIAKVDGRAGTATIIWLYVGGTIDSIGEDVTKSAGNALITGEGSLNVNKLKAVYLFNGSTVSADVLKDWMDDAKNTQFYVDGTVWLTIYCKSDCNMLIVYADSTGITYTMAPQLENAKFNGWQIYDEKTKTYKFAEAVNDLGYCKATYVGDPGYEKVYASIDRSIYDVSIVADMGIDDIFIDGKIILKDKTSNTFTEKVAAGTHAITYTLANGYSGNASIIAIDGKAISGSGLTFVIDDDKAGTDMKMEITVSGIEKSGYDTDPETHDEKVSGLTTTEILPIVAVIIMAVMAVVLILRLNRS